MIVLSGGETADGGREDGDNQPGKFLCTAAIKNNNLYFYGGEQRRASTTHSIVLYPLDQVINFSLPRPEQEIVPSLHAPIASLEVIG